MFITGPVEVSLKDSLISSTHLLLHSTGIGVLVLLDDVYESSGPSSIWLECPTSFERILWWNLI